MGGTFQSKGAAGKGLVRLEKVNNFQATESQRKKKNNWKYRAKVKTSKEQWEDT